METILIEEGIAGLTLTAVAVRSGSAVGSLYRFFSNREQIVEAVVARLRKSLEEDWASLAKAQPDFGDTEAFTVWYTNNFRTLVERHPVFPAVVRHLSEHCEPLERIALQPLHDFFSARVPRMLPSRRAIACRLLLAMTTEALQMSSRLRAIPQRQIWDGACDGISLLLQAYLTQNARSQSIRTRP